MTMVVDITDACHATMEWKLVLQRTSSCAWKCCFVATVGILFAFHAI